MNGSTSDRSGLGDGVKITNDQQSCMAITVARSGWTVELNYCRKVRKSAIKCAFYCGNKVKDLSFIEIQMAVKHQNDKGA